MSKFTDLCDAYNAARRSTLAYHARSCGFGAELIQRFRDYLEIPTGNFRVVPLHEEALEGRQYSIASAMHMHDDGYWHLGGRLTLDPEGAPKQVIVLRFMFKGAEGGYLVKMSPEGFDHAIRSGDEASFAQFFESVQTAITDYYAGSSERGVDPSTTNTFGFIA